MYIRIVTFTPKSILPFHYTVRKSSVLSHIPYRKVRQTADKSMRFLSIQ